jgi:hypothetical protein
VVPVVSGTEGGASIVVGVVDRRLAPHDTRATDAASSPIAARLLAIAALSAEMAPEVGEES